MTIDDIVRHCRRDTRCIGGPERLALCDEVERLREVIEKHRNDSETQAIMFYRSGAVWRNYIAGENFSGRLDEVGWFARVYPRKKRESRKARK